MAIGGQMIASGMAGIKEGRLTVGLRAEDIHPAASGTGVPFAVRYVEELGAQRLVHGSVEGRHLTIALSPDLPLADEMRVVVAADRLHFFEDGSGRRITRQDQAGR